MPEIKIDKDVPLQQHRVNKNYYPLKEMKVGDSFFVTQTGTHPVSTSILSCARYYKVKVRSRTVTENGIKGIRVWRIE